MTANEMMTTKEVAAYLRIKERKVYELVSERRIPCSRVTGKWLFPKTLIDLWIVQNSEGADDAVASAKRPSVVAGSHDPLLEWAIRESRAELAAMFNNSLDGLIRFARQQVLMTGLHVYDPASETYNVELVRKTLQGGGHVLIEWARRQQGLIVAAGNPKGVAGLEDLRASALTIVDRQRGAGSRALFEHLLAAKGIDRESLRFTEQPALSETDLALAVLDGKADVGFGIAAVARQFRLDFLALHEERQFRLDFLALHEERYDIAITRRDYFEPPAQTLFAFTRTEAFRLRAGELGGYDLTGAGRAVLNAG